MWRVMETPLNCAEEQQPPPAFPASWSTVTPQESPADRNDKGNAVGFVLVHAGAGYHSESKAKEYKHVCKRACQRDSPFTNAGMGSNLNLSGEIECDASIMDGKSLRYGAVGAVSGINNPVLVANRLLSEAQKGKLSAGRIPPCFLVGRGAHDWAVNHGIPPCPSEKMATKFSLSAYKRNKHKMELAEKVDTGFNHHSKKRRQASETENGSGLLDTVGAIVVDREGNVAAAVSSGGLAMKHPGRVGQAAHHGCGCWAENTSTLNPYSTAVSTSGCGEHLIRTMLARECSSAMQCEDAHQALLEAMQNKFISSPFLASEDCVLGGVIVLRCCRCSDAQPSPDIQAILVEFLWSHTTESMCVGYMSAQDGKAKTHISRLPPGAVAGQSLAIEGGVCRLVNTPTTVD
ncbi:threonine aspartase 1 isoform X2 [Oncorhynchus tshawytscha]|uniref:Threonine aspartase 1 n=1 Tax=Oncorhynchus tshawytscha TaxID=74940 RepID=A0AAZ3PXD8_ONCTS|nr:threonine aspartase 1 isoform X2 [Oncorhynchus kisutch]XP_042161579.1 threonine aspartase 1 isoform X2 [Oncorhynchus tshawytscha]